MPCNNDIFVHKNTGVAVDVVAVQFQENGRCYITYGMRIIIYATPTDSCFFLVIYVRARTHTQVYRIRRTVRVYTLFSMALIPYVRRRLRRDSTVGCHTGPARKRNI